MKNTMYLKLALFCFVLLLTAGLSLFAVSAKNEVVFIADGGTGDGSSAASPLKAPDGSSPLVQAVDALSKTGGTVVICGKLTLDGSCGTPDEEGEIDVTLPEHGDRTIVITSFYNGVDYREKNGAMLIFRSPANLTIGGYTVFRNVTIATQSNGKTDFSTHRVIAAAGHRLTMEAGVRTTALDAGGFEILTPAPSLYPTLCGGRRVGDCEGDAEIVVKSGTFDSIAAGPYGSENTSSVLKGNATVHLYDGVFMGDFSGTSLDKTESAETGGTLTGNSTFRIDGGLYYGCLFASSPRGYAGNDSIFSVILGGGRFLSEGLAFSASSASGEILGNKPKEANLDAGSLSVEKAASYEGKFKSAKEDAENGFLMAENASDAVLFISDKGTGDGSSPEKPLKAETVTKSNNENEDRYRNSVFYQAFQKLSVSGGTIVLVGEVKLDYSVGNGTSVTTLDFKLPKTFRPITITSVYNGVDYRTKGGAKLIIQNPINLIFAGDATFENVEIDTMSWAIPSDFKTNSSQTSYKGKTIDTTRVIAAHGNKLIMGEGVETSVLDPNGKPVKNPAAARYPALCGAHRYSNSTYDTDLTVLSGTWSTVTGGTYGVKSGSYGTSEGTNRVRVGGTAVIHTLTGTSVNENDFAAHTGSIDILIEGGTIKTEVVLVGINGLGSGDDTYRIKVTGGDLKAAAITAVASKHTNAAPHETTIDFTEYPEMNKTIYNKIRDFTNVLISSDKTEFTSVKSLPEKTTYYVGELFNPTGLAVKASLFGKDTLLNYSEDNPAFSFDRDLSLPLTEKDTEIKILFLGEEIASLPITVGGISPVSILGAKIKTDSENESLLFVGQIAKEKIDSVVSYGFLVVPSSLINSGDSLSFEKMSGMEVIDCTGKKLIGGENGALLFGGSFDGIPVQNYATEYTAVAYYSTEKDGKPQYEYSLPIERSVYAVAVDAIGSGNELLSSCVWMQRNVIDKADADVKGTYNAKAASVNAANVLGYMEKMASVVWTPTKQIDFSSQSSFTSKVKYEAGKEYHGLPYTNGTADYEGFKNHLVGTRYPVSDSDSYFTVLGNVCSSAPFYSWVRFGNSMKTLLNTSTMMPALKNGFYAVGEYAWQDLSYATTLDIINASGKSTDDGLQTIYRAYSLLQPGDAVLSRWIKNDEFLGHIRLVASEPNIVYSPNGLINPDRSTIKLTEQSSSLSDSPYGKKEKWSTNWRVNLEWTLSSLANAKDGSAKYLPITMTDYYEGYFEKPFCLVKNSSSSDTIASGLSGEIVSNYDICYLNAKILKGNETVVENNSFFRSKRKAALSDAIGESEFASLPSGSYECVITVFCGGRERTVLDLSFTK